MGCYKNIDDEPRVDNDGGLLQREAFGIPPKGRNRGLLSLRMGWIAAFRVVIR